MTRQCARPAYVFGLGLLVAGSAAAGAGDAQNPQAFNAALGLRASTTVTLDINPKPGEPILAVVPIEGVPLVLDLQPHSVRAARYQVLAQIEDGSLLSVDPGPVRTLRGSLLGIPGSVAAGSLLEDGLYARIALPDGEAYWVEPMASRVAGALPDEYVVYRGDDVLAGDGTCATDAALAAPVHRDVAGGGSGTAATSGVCVAEFAADADYEYFSAYGSVPAVEARINSIINTVNIQYERDVGITHIITTIIVRTAEPDPYDTIFPGTLLLQFRDEWLANQSDIQRDVAQLFSGRDFYGTYIGYAWVAEVCTDFGFSVVQSDYDPNFAYVTDLSAHELGHNWGADHCSCTDPPYTMYGLIQGANEFSPTETIPEILAVRDSSTCLDECDGGGGGSPPTAPSQLGATAMSSSDIDLTWIDNAADESGFEIERSLDEITWEWIAEAGSNVTSYSDTSLAAGTTYFYRVLAYNANGASAYSNTASATTPAKHPPGSLEAMKTAVTITRHPARRSSARP